MSQVKVSSDVLFIKLATKIDQPNKIFEPTRMNGILPLAGQEKVNWWKIFRDPDDAMMDESSSSEEDRWGYEKAVLQFAVSSVEGESVDLLFFTLGALWLVRVSFCPRLLGHPWTKNSFS